MILSYDGLGLPAFPANPQSKRPLLKGWQQRATDDAHGLYRLAANFPRAGVGLIMGGEIRPGEYVFALDVDPRKGGDRSLRRLLRRLGLHIPSITATALTGGGGTHYLLTAPFPVKSLTDAFGSEFPGLDTKGVGGYIVAAPSVHPKTGKEYRWLRHPRAGISRAPRRLLGV